MPLYTGGIIGDVAKTQIRTGTVNTIQRRAYVAIGASGAPTVTTSDGITVTRSSAGVYTGTCPVTTAVSATNQPTLRIWVVQSAAITVSQCTITAFAPQSGTFGFTSALNTAGTAVDPANGDILGIEYTASDLNG